MNFNEEMMEELAELGLGGQLVTVADEDKGTDQDYIALEQKLKVADIETTRIIRESSKNARLGLPCGSSLVDEAVKLRQELTGSFYGIEELQRIYMIKPIAMCLVKDNISQSDFGSNQTVEHSHKIKHLTRNLK